MNDLARCSIGVAAGQLASGSAGARLTAGLLLGLGACLCGTRQARADDWPQWRGLNRDGKSAETGLLKKWPSGGPKRIWKVTGIGGGFSGPAVTNGRIFTTGLVGENLVVKALDLGGKAVWRITHGPGWKKSHPGSRATPTVDGERMYLLSGKGLLSCYGVSDGRRKWSVDITRKFGGKAPKWGYAESPLVYGNLVVVSPGGPNCIVALDKKSGRRAWTSKGFSDVIHYSSCIGFEFKGVSLIATMTSKALVCVSAADGRFLWRNDRAAGKTAICPTPVYSEGYVFGASGYGNGGACQRLSVRGRRLVAQQAWSTDDMDCHHGGYVVVDGYIYGNHKSGWNCLDLKTGRKMWSARGVGKGSICYADGMLYTFSERGGRIGLVPATPRGFALAGEFKVEGSGKSWAHPVVAGGRLYLRYGDNLYAYDVKAR